MSHSGSGETGTGSIEVSVQTDLTVTSDGESEEPKHINIKRHARDIHILTSEKKQLQVLNEKLQLELREKEALLSSSKAQYNSLLEQKRFQSDVQLSEKQGHVTRLEAELLTAKDELKLLKERAAKELAHLLQKCFEFQQNQNRFMVKHDEIKNSLQDLVLSEEEFLHLRTLPRDHLNLKQFVSLRVYEMVMPLKTRVKELETITSSLEGTVGACERQLESKFHENAKLTDEVNRLRERVVHYSNQCDELREEIKLDDFRIHNFDRIKRERDKYEQDIETLERARSDLQLQKDVNSQEKKILEERIGELKTKLRNQELELSKYKNDYFEVKGQLEKDKTDAMKTSSRLKLEQDRSEDFHEKFLKAKAEVISLNENLQDAHNEIKVLKDKLISGSKTENETREQFLELQKRHFDLSNEFESLQGKYIKEKDALRVEIGELRASYSSLSKSYNEILEKNNKLLTENQQKYSVLQDERLNKEEIVLKLKQESNSLKKELEKYKALESDYLSTLKVFASVPDTDKHLVEGVIPASSIVKGKLSEETVSLTRRILHLERQNVEACSTIRKFTVTLDQMRSSLSSYKAALSMAGKPSLQLLERIRSQEEQIMVLEEALKACKESKESILRDCKNLREELNSAKTLIDDAKCQKEEVVVLKTEMANLSNWITRNMNKVRRDGIPPAIKITKGS